MQGLTTPNCEVPAIALAGLHAHTARPDGAVAAAIMIGGNCDLEIVQRVVSDEAFERRH